MTYRPHPTSPLTLNRTAWFLSILLVLILVGYASLHPASSSRADEPAWPEAASAEQPEPKVPPREYLISIHYDLGMHCTGFDFSYCCILPPYNSILAQVVKTSSGPHVKPSILKESDLAPKDLILWYEHENNTYSEGPKMLYWNLPDDVNGDGDTSDPNDSYANTAWKHLFTYAEAPLRFRPYPRGLLTKRYLGIDLPVPQDHGRPASRSATASSTTPDRKEPCCIRSPMMASPRRRWCLRSVSTGKPSDSRSRRTSTVRSATFAIPARS